MSRAWLLAPGAALLGALMFYRLESFPGLHGDEAWAGLYAIRILRNGLYSPHEMNAYTGPIYGWLLSGVFARFGVSMAGLRLPGALLNAAAALAFLVHVSRRFGAGAGLAWLYVLAGSGLFLLKARVAWEVYALQSFLLVAALLCAHRFLDREDRSFLNAAAFLTVLQVGVLNHFIFLSVPASLFLAALAHILIHREERAVDFLALTGAALALGAVLCLVKPALSEELWRAYRPGWAALFWLSPAAAAWALSASGFRRARSAAPVLLALPARAGGGLRGVLIAGLVLFFFFHWVALIRVWSNVAVLERLASWRAPDWLAVPLYAWAAALLSSYFVLAAKGLKPERLKDAPLYERLLTLWPLVYAAVFPAFRNTSSLRYYIIPSFLIMAALSVLLPRVRLRRPAVAAGLAAVAACQLCFWRQAAAFDERPPLRFRVGWHKEDSSAFMAKGSLFRLVDRERICRLRQDVDMIDLPVFFHLNTRRGDCDLSKTIATRYCWECDRPPYIEVRVLK